MQTIDSFLDEWTSAERAGDTSALAALLTDDFTGVGPLGFVLPKAAWLARHQQGASATNPSASTKRSPGCTATRP
jgi:hypothetical protein